MNDFTRTATPWPETGVRPYMASKADAPAFWQVDILWLILATSADTGGQYCLMEQLCPKESGPPPHYHDQDESFYILDGTVTLLTDGKETVAKTGAFATVPRGTVHSFRVDSETARVLNWYSPAGFEIIITEGSVPAERRELPPPGVKKEMSPETMQALIAKGGMHFVNEPDVLRQPKR